MTLFTRINRRYLGGLSTSVLFLLIGVTVTGCEDDSSAFLEEYAARIDNDPTKPLPYIQRAALYNSLGRHADAVQDANKAVELAPNSSAAYAVRGGAYYGQGEFDRALEDLDMAVSLSAHHDPSTLRMRGDVYTALGERSSAKKDYSEARAVEMHIAPNP